jgi:N-acetylmuramoyl-L-alanine amidase CwlA
MKTYTVKVDWIPGLPQIPFRHGTGAYEGVVMHETANPSDTAAGERAWQARTFNNAFVHEFIDPNEIIQVANPMYIAYGAGRVANQRFLHLELCSAHSRDEFERAFDMWCQRAAFFLAKSNLGVSPAAPDGSGTLWGHFQVTDYLGGTNHTDPVGYLKNWGRTWNDVINRVRQHYDWFQKGAEIPMTVEDAGKLIGILGAIWYMLPDQAGKDEIHRLANELRKASGQPVEN